MRIVYMGTPDFAVPPLRSLAETEYEVAAIITQPDKPKGRAGERGSGKAGNSCVSAGKGKRSGICGNTQRTAAGSDCCGGIRADHSGGDSEYAEIRMH